MEEGANDGVGGANDEVGGANDELATLDRLGVKSDEISAYLRY